jgi:hypothetical protein
MDQLHEEQFLVMFKTLSLTFYIYLTSGPAFWVGRAGPLPQALTLRGRQKGGHRPATH